MANDMAEMRHPVHAQHLTHIGDIFVSFALLEQAISPLIGSLIREHQAVGQIVTAPLAFKHLRALAVSLYIERHGKDDSDYKRLRVLMNEAGTLSNIRDLFAHLIWGAGRTVEYICRMKYMAQENDGLRFTRPEELSVEDIATDVRRIRKCAQEVSDFWLQLLRDQEVFNNPIGKMW